MQVKLLQLNMWAGTHFPAIQKFLRENDFDILCFQEVCGPKTYVGNIRCEIDCFEKLKQTLGPLYEGQLAKASFLTSSPEAYDGNAIFYKKEFHLKKTEVIWITKRDTPFPSDALSFEEMGRNGISLLLEKADKQLSVVTAHLPWANTKEEQPYQRERNRHLVSYIQTLPSPWILTGDFNILPTQPTIDDLDRLGKNLDKQYGVSNTVDPKVHYNWEKMKPGSTIDYIFLSPDIKAIDFRVRDDQHISDHFALTATIEL